jgi:hypothetical protein
MFPFLFCFLAGVANGMQTNHWMRSLQLFRLQLQAVAVKNKLLSISSSVSKRI